MLQVEAEHFLFPMKAWHIQKKKKEFYQKSEKHVMQTNICIWHFDTHSDELPTSWIFFSIAFHKHYVCMLNLN